MELDHSAAYVAARTAFGAVARASDAWPPPLAIRARSTAMDALVATAEGVVARSRRHVRAALAASLQLAAACDHARARDAQLAVGRSIVALALLLHAEGVAGDLG